MSRKLDDFLIDDALTSWGEWITKYCNEKKETYADFADGVGVSRGTVYKWVAGGSYGSVKAIIDVLDTLGYKLVIKEK